MPKKFYIVTFCLTFFQFAFLFSAAVTMFKVKHYNHMLLEEIDYLDRKMEKDLLALNVRKTEYSMLSSPYSLSKLAKIYLDNDYEDQVSYKNNFRKLDKAALILNPYGKAIARLP